jgi:endonuclease-8
MPEGDTLHRIAATLSRALGGQKLVKVSSPVAEVGGADLAGHVIAEVVALGKNLVIRFDDGRMLHTHLRMHGSWHIYRPNERWRRPMHDARVVLDVGDIVAVCFGAPTVRLLTSARSVSDAQLGGLGPDIVADDFDQERALARLAARVEIPIGVALLDQTALAGIGNVYKSETLFLCRADPFLPVSSYDAARLADIVAQARKLMRANIRPQGSIRTTRGGGRYWVYCRAGRPCFRCHATIHMQRQGKMRRSTYYCPTCQGVARGADETPRYGQRGD